MLPARFTLGARPVMQAPAEALLQGLAVAEDVRGDDPEDRKEATPSQQRIEAKLDLVLSLLGRLARRQGPRVPPAHHVHPCQRERFVAAGGRLARNR